MISHNRKYAPHHKTRRRPLTESELEQQIKLEEGLHLEEEGDLNPAQLANILSEVRIGLIHSDKEIQRNYRRIISKLNHHLPITKEDQPTIRELYKCALEKIETRYAKIVKPNSEPFQPYNGVHMARYRQPL